MNVNKYEVRFFAVGSGTKGGDAIFIRLIDESNNTNVILIDGGYQEDGGKIVKYMKVLGLDTIDVVINTHPDLDHISGLLTVFRSDLKIKKLIFNRPWRDAKMGADLFKDERITDKSLNKRLTENFKKAYELEQIAIEKEGCEIVHPTVGNCYFDCLHVLGPTTEHYRKYLLQSDKTPTTADGETAASFKKIVLQFKKFLGGIIPWNDALQTSAINETSVVCWLKLPDVNFLFTGDVGKVGLKCALDRFNFETNGRVEITHLQLPHHGSQKNINPDLLREIGATDYFISCPPDGDTDGHPSRKLVNKILEIYPNASIQRNRENRNFVYHSSNLPIEAVGVACMTAYDEIED